MRKKKDSILTLIIFIPIEETPLDGDQRSFHEILRKVYND